jgi:ABC-type transport system involved in resistance to organic solvents, periplasmic component
MMPKNKRLELAVGFFLLLGLMALLVLALKVSSLGLHTSVKNYQVTAVFDNIGDLKVRAPVTLSGVHIGEVTQIHINPKTFKAMVSLAIFQNQTHLPEDSSASIYTQGLLGSNYISLTPGFDDQHVLQNGSTITNTHSALILENLIGQFLFSINKSDEAGSKSR